jgi:mono/diheme cytochrome c family protein
MHARTLPSADQPRKISLRRVFWCALAILLCSAATTASAQSSSPAPAARASTKDTTSTRESSRAAAAINAGRIVFNQRCQICHFIDSDAQKIGPGLKRLFASAKFADGTRVSDASVATIIGEGGKDMPGYQDVLKPGQLQALIAYLKSR